MNKWRTAVAAKFLLVFSIAVGLNFGSAARGDTTTSLPLNVLFIAVDDLRPLLGCYGNTTVHSPNIDQLAAGGIVFNRAYCQQAVCSPSRTSLLTGLRPDATHIYDLTTHFRSTVPNVVTLPQAFREHGYHTQSFGKIYHGGLDDPRSWSVPSDFGTTANPDDTRYTSATQLGKKQGEEEGESGGRKVRGQAVQAVDAADDALPDGYIAAQAVQTLQQIKDHPFFLAVGFHKPHLPFVAPKKYFDLYSRERLPEAPNPFPPQGNVQYALTNWGELRSYRGIPKNGPLTEEAARELVHGYYAATSYSDAQVGRVLAEVERLGLKEKTVVVLWGDHGWHLGEHGMWTKHTNFEIATHAPLIFRDPVHLRTPAHSDALVEFVDIYPTLCEVCGVPAPAGLQGRSLVPLFADPKASWSSAAFSQFPRGKDVMGYTMRTDRHRYTEWRSISTNATLATELYDELVDPNENVNRALITTGLDPTLTPTLSRLLNEQINRGFPKR